MKKIILVVALLFLVACAQQTQTVKVAWIGPLTGEVAALGIDNLDGVKLAVEELNAQGANIELIVEDDAYDPMQTVKAFQKVTQVDGAEIVLSPSYSGMLAVSNQADYSQIVVINSLDTSEEIAAAGDYIFGVGIYDEGIGYEMAEFAITKGKSAAVIYNTEDAFMGIVREAFETKFKELGGRVISEGYTFDTTDFRTVLTKVRNNDILVVMGYDESGLILKQAKELKVGSLILGTDTVTSQNFLENAGSGADDMYFTSWDITEEYEPFVKKFEAKYDRTPDQPLFSAAGYDAVKVLAVAMEQGTDAVSVHDGLYQIKDVKGVTGTLTMSEDGIVRTVEEIMFQHPNEPVKLA